MKPWGTLLQSVTNVRRSNSINSSSPPFLTPTIFSKPKSSSITVIFFNLFPLVLMFFHFTNDSTTVFSPFEFGVCSIFRYEWFLWFGNNFPVLSDDVPLVVSRQLLQSFAQELGRLEPETQKEIAQFTLTQIQPRVVSFEEQVLFSSFGFSNRASTVPYRLVSVLYKPYAA